MGNDTVNYDYDLIEQTVRIMKEKAEEIEADVAKLRGDVQQLLSGWTGDSAESYNSLSLDLGKDLDNHQLYLEDLKDELRAAATGMNGADVEWAKKIMAGGGR
ncbi:WXG100 family type VII secretion target [Actinokineospora pegani]|uniref:WXG100 family type VII secretion target n=1 Tax=Actinokineospora pegani TaxID=2654637 RepID=UPI0012EA1779|nr:WXG100 family type VII secretion target [Actinokineospora pegani]